MNQPAFQIFETECRNCERTVRQKIELEGSEGAKTAVRLRCAGCGTSNHASLKND